MYQISLKLIKFHHIPLIFIKFNGYPSSGPLPGGLPVDMRRGPVPWMPYVAYIISTHVCDQCVPVITINQLILHHLFSSFSADCLCKKRILCIYLAEETFEVFMKKKKSNILISNFFDF